jgi:hypothetical protein
MNDRYEKQGRRNKIDAKAKVHGIDLTLRAN